MSVTGNSGKVMPSWFVWSPPSFSVHKFFFPGLTVIHLTFQIARRTKKGCIGLSIGLISSFPSRKLNTIFLLNGLSLEVSVKAELYPSSQQSQLRNLLQACLRWALISPFEGKLQRFILAIHFFIVKRINFFQRYSPLSQNRYPFFGVTESRTNRSITNFPSSAPRLLHPTLKYASNPTKILLWLAKNLKNIHLKDWGSTRMEIWVIGSMRRNSWIYMLGSSFFYQMCFLNSVAANWVEVNWSEFWFSLRAVTLWSSPNNTTQVSRSQTKNCLHSSSCLFQQLYILSSRNSKINSDCVCEYYEMKKDNGENQLNIYI